jgi:hypothetical protein
MHTSKTKKSGITTLDITPGYHSGISTRDFNPGF